MSDTNGNGGGGIAIGDVGNGVAGYVGDENNVGEMNTGLSTSASD
jgi:hypothetical protein